MTSLGSTWDQVEINFPVGIIALLAMLVFVQYTYMVLSQDHRVIFQPSM
jgi:hypothetical protein